MYKTDRPGPVQRFSSSSTGRAGEQAVREVKVHLGTGATRSRSGRVSSTRPDPHAPGCASVAGRRLSRSRPSHRTRRGGGQPAGRRLRTDVLLVPEGEESKSLREAERLWDAFLARPRSVLPRRRRRRRRGGRPGGVRRGGVHARPAGDPGADDTARPGRRVRRREGGRQPSAGQEPDRRLPSAPPRLDRPGGAPPCRSGSTARGSPRS